MKFNDGKTISAYVRSKLHSGYITIPLPPPPRGLTPPTKRIFPAKCTEHIAEALKEVMLELEPMAPAMRKYRKYLQRQNTDDDDITKTKM